MRLTCPNCDAQYEVPDDVIPQEGRDVQCSNCGNTWFCAHPDNEDVALAAPEDVQDDSSWAPEVSDEETLKEPVADPIEQDLGEDAPSAEPTGPVSMASDATDEVLADAVKAAISRVRSGADATEEPDASDTRDDTPELEVGADGHDLDAEADDFESDLDEALDAIEDEVEVEVEVEVEESPPEDPEDKVFFEPEVETPAKVDAPDTEPQTSARRSIDPTVANILQEEAAIEADLRAQETALESQPDLGLSEPDDEIAMRARQSRERMARMRGLPADAADKPIEPVPENSRRDLLPDIDEINSTLRATEDRAPDEQPDGRPTLTQRRAGGSRIGFALAILLVALGVFAYSQPETITERLPAAESVVTSYVGIVDSARVQLDRQMTSLMLWLDGLTSDSGA